MIIKYKKRDGSPAELKLEEKSITIGRSPDADIIVLDERASRMHSGIRFWEGDYYLKDLQSKNGTWVNGEKIEMQKIGPGDQFRIGTSKFFLEGDHGEGHIAGTDTISREVASERDSGKGVGTIMREIVAEVDKTPEASAPVASEETVIATPAAAAAPPKPGLAGKRPPPPTMAGKRPSPPKLVAKKPSAPVAAADENVFDAPEDDIGKNTTMPIAGLDDAVEQAAEEKPKIKLSLKGSLADKAGSPASAKPTLKKPGQIKLKKPGS